MKACLYSNQEGTWFYGNWDISNTSKFYRYVCFVDKITYEITEVSVAQKKLREEVMKHIAKNKAKRWVRI